MISSTKPLAKARVALLYGPGNMAADYAAALPRGLERGLLELGADVATLNLSFFKRHIRDGRHRHGEESPYVQGIKAFVEENAGPSGFDYCLGLFYDQYLTPGLMEVLRRRCRTIINYPLNLVDQPSYFEAATRFCDVTFCSEEEPMEGLEKQFPGKLRYVPMAADPYIFRPLAAPPEPRLLFVGSIYADRLWLLEAAARHLPVSIFGWNYTLPGVLRNVGGEVRRGRRVSPLTGAKMLARVLGRSKVLLSDEEFVRLAADHGVSLGLSEVRAEDGTLHFKVRLREYEASMAGLCHIVRRMPEVLRHWDDGAEMLTYQDNAELPELLERIRRGEVDWRRVGARARARSAREHTWTARLATAFGHLPPAALQK